MTALRRAHVTVELALAGGFEVEGRVGRHPETGRLVWLVRAPEQRDWSLLMPYRTPQPHRRWAPRRREPVLWRPLAGVIWPDPLPDPVTAALPTPPPPPVEAEPPPPAEVDEWPCPGLRLGERVPPVSLAECEARVLRAIRRMAAEPDVGHGRRTLARDIPAEIILAGRRIQEAWNLHELMREGRIPTDAPPARVAWTPTRRDHGDWQYALDWWRRLAGQPRRIVGMRAANPVYSWRQIGEMERLTGAGARGVYARAVEAMFRMARGG